MTVRHDERGARKTTVTTAMSAPQSDHRFLFLFEGDHEAPASDLLTRLEVPPGPSTMTITRGGDPRISSAPRRARGATSLLLEPVLRGGRPRLLAVRPQGPAPRLNGLPAPKIAVLGLGDQLRLRGGPVLHLSAEVPAPRREAGAEHAGIECPLCRVPIETGRWVYVCPDCGTAMHDEPEETGASDRLECARLTERCRGCESEIHFAGGLLYAPEE